MDSSHVPGADSVLGTHRLRDLVRALEALGGPLQRADAAALLARSELRLADVAPFVEESPRGYTRRRVARTEWFELLVLTWRPGQGSAPHDHAGSLCALKVLRGQLCETRFAPAPDGFVDPESSAELAEGQIAIDASPAVHALVNPCDACAPVVSLHLYAPPLPELRRHVARPSGAAPQSAFRRPRAAGARTVAVIGAGFSGTLAAAQLLARASAAGRPLHVALFERHCALGEGAAYRTLDPGHLLNVPASNMSAWPERPGDFAAWAQARDAAVAPSDFLPRRLYAEYVRETLHAVAAHAAPAVSAELRAGEVSAVERTAEGSWRVVNGRGALTADAVVLACGLRPPDDPIGERWRGSAARYIRDPWASLALAAIRPDEPVVLLGSGLTALDVLLALAAPPRSAMITAISRHGLLPESHRTPDAPAVRLDPTAWLAPLLARADGPPLRELVRALRAAVRSAETRGEDWRAVIDGLRPHTAAIWHALAQPEAARFLRHARPFWEVARHRAPPGLGAHVRELRAAGVFRVIAARIGAVHASDDAVELELRRRGARTREVVRSAWIVNCTGPGSCGDTAKLPLIGALVEAGHLTPDPLGLGVLTDTDGCALANGRARPDLVVVGALRRAQLWESTAVPELRAQAAAAAGAVLTALD